MLIILLPTEPAVIDTLKEKTACSIRLHTKALKKEGC